jgi:flagellar motor switch protein FliG
MSVPNLPAAPGQSAPAALSADAAKLAPDGAEAAGPALTLADKAAIIIAALGPEAAPHVLQGMGETTIRRFAQAMSGLWKISPELLQQTIADFTEELGAHHQIKGGASEARRILQQLLDDDSVSRIMDDVDVAGGRTLWEKLSNSSDQALAGFLRHEHPQTAAVVLSKMRSDKAARILERLDPEFAQIIVLRLARVPRLDSEVMELITSVIQREFLSVMQREQATRRPADVIGSMMNNVSAGARARLLQQLEQEKPKLARQVQKVMFTFTDLSTRVDARDAGILMKGVDEKVLVMALKFAESNAPRVVDFFMTNISKRLAQRLEGEIKAHPDVNPRDGEAAQAQVVTAAREMAKAGELKLAEMDDEE